MEDENDESWLYGNSEGKEKEQPPGTENDALPESKENDTSYSQAETQPVGESNENEVNIYGRNYFRRIFNNKI